MQQQEQYASLRTPHNQWPAEAHQRDRRVLKLNNDERAALATFANEMAAAFNKLAVGLGGGMVALDQPPTYGPASLNLPWNERVLRQCLILHEIVERGGSVPRTTWYEIAGRYGYAGRGLAGFFRNNKMGLLELRNNETVQITKRGRERLAQNKERVSTELLKHPTAHPAAAANGK